MSRTAFQVKKIAIIGAGPCGLSAAKYLKAQGVFDSIVIYEQQGETGGIWSCSKSRSKEDSFVDNKSFYSPDHLARQHHDPNMFSSPIYNQLYANIPKSLMQFSDHPFPPKALLFPPRGAIEDYLLQYANEVRQFIKFNIQVRNIVPAFENGKTTWELEAVSISDNRIIRDNYDAVVVATGHYSVPFIPDMKNIKEFMDAYPSIISHSRDYRTPNSFKDKKTIVVGNGPSGTDIAFQINRTSIHKTMISVRTATPPARLAYMACEEVSEIEEFIINGRGIKFKDGRIELEIDSVIFCTGFLYDYPFLPNLRNKLITTGYGVHGLYKHIFCIDHPTIAFPGLNIKTPPWPLSEAQAAVFASVWSNNIQLPPTDMMKKWAEDLYENQGEELHIFRTPLSDALYINELHKWVRQSPLYGKEPPFCDDALLWQRSIFAQAKLRFEEDGCRAISLEDLGFCYDPGWK
jgi:thioredoxin reductase